MIKGIGIDLIEIDRVERSIQSNQKFIDRILTENEKTLYNALKADHRKAEFVAGRFAAKEALGKAMGTGIGKEFSFQDISITKSDQGAPKMKVKNCPYKVWVSISHSQSHAIAQVVLEG
ncbi:holo-ACP synthase [Pontibacillus sp. HMF3514]|uniref:holo-ACP synthase n=1 Tax=Pontibacillus sp. HMF3514 TaxID=2692425 RepID=UPI00132027F9|nr:holo-ACP synthase [Pontibacillus sp. HMF3514]QHE50834.1 holo-ACP synthase [Pontibacillus sp. HMF3514]